MEKGWPDRQKCQVSIPRRRRPLSRTSAPLHRLCPPPPALHCALSLPSLTVFLPDLPASSPLWGLPSTFLPQGLGTPQRQTWCPVLCALPAPGTDPEKCWALPRALVKITNGLISTFSLLMLFLLISTSFFFSLKMKSSSSWTTRWKGVEGTSNTCSC